MSSILSYPSIRNFINQGYRLLIESNGKEEDQAKRVIEVFHLLEKLPLKNQNVLLKETSLGAIKKNLDNLTDSDLCIRKIYPRALDLFKQLVNPLETIPE